MLCTSPSRRHDLHVRSVTADRRPEIYGDDFPRAAVILRDRLFVRLPNNQRAVTATSQVKLRYKHFYRRAVKQPRPRLSEE